MILVKDVYSSMFTVWQPLCKAMFSFSLTVGYRNAGHDTFYFF